MTVTICGDASADVITLYDDTVGNLPGDQGWLDDFELGGMANEMAHAQGTRVQSDMASGAGYSNYSPLPLPTINPSFPSLNDADGYSLSFQLQVFAESHVSQDRAGFSVIALGNNNRGIELGFWEDRIFAQDDSPIFTHGEDAVFNTKDSEAEYVLTIQNDGYVLSADTQNILSGSLRDYTAATGLPASVVYNLPNYLFVGDNTTSASVDFALGSVVLNSNLSAVPEPSAFAALSLIVGTIGWTRCRRGLVGSTPPAHSKLLEVCPTSCS